ncbi:M23 family metallopeptidase [Streptomyces albipurpureus]|uniref:Peptidoglycan DD-metalloendopeptidase family protein n=1 Tax=Streptomyces albipurpureus TaxID=2897419 RepID=A0ABT0V0M0_9ACTN|nr:peptidoglycan DD-metalloendopeptidase family protein [Streptomyces sp. CWNU-1]MCM2392951.1 peptidoglycan DD-metalloendopeptidase family protein [Streptomyces sp. CWNU-1]
MNRRLLGWHFPVFGWLISGALLLIGAGATPSASVADHATRAGPVSAVIRAETAEAPRSWPMGPPRPLVVRGWEPPASSYGPGHRGVDLAAPAGSEVLAVAAGRISFAGQVAGRGVLSINLTGTGDPALRTTYEPVDPALPVGTEVTAGQPVGTVASGASHCATGCLHWGLLRGTEYLDPLSLLPPGMLSRTGHRLLPVTGTRPLTPEASLPGAPALAHRPPHRP